MKATIEITADKTILHVEKLKIEGINPDRLTYTVREYWDPEGSVYEVEHIPTKTTARNWVSNGLMAAIEECERKVNER